MESLFFIELLIGFEIELPLNFYPAMTRAGWSFALLPENWIILS
jgi:hypothetical protein